MDDGKRYKCYGCGDHFKQSEGKFRVTKRDFLCRDCLKKERKKSRQAASDFKRFLKTGHTCPLCGYSGCTDAFDFHHLYNKKFDLSVVKTISAYICEAAKCVLVCANCHREIHFGMHDEIDLEKYRLTTTWLSKKKTKFLGYYSLFD